MPEASVPKASAPEPSVRRGPVRFVVSADQPLRGMERAATEVVASLREAGLDVVLHVVRPGPPPRPGWSRALALAASFLRARAAVREPAAAVVVVGIWMALLALPWAVRTPHPVIAWEHSLTTERRAASRSFALVAALVLPMYRRRVACVVAVSPAVAGALGARLELRTVVIANPVAAEPPQRRRPAADLASGPAPGPGPGHGLRLLALGGLVPIKAPHLLLAMMTEFSAVAGDTTHLDVAGDGPLLGPLRADAERRGLAERVTFHGFVGDVAPLLAGADVLVHTSASETFGYALLEAAAAGVPVVAVENSQTRHLVPRLVPGRTCAPSGQALAAAVRAAAAHDPGDTDAADHAQAEAAARRARREAFDPDAMVTAWRAVLA